VSVTPTVPFTANGPSATGRAVACATIVLCALALAACGGAEDEEGSGGAEIPGGADPEQARVIEEWSTALREGDVEAAADHFEIPSVAQNGTPPLELDSRADVVAFNDALPCGAELIRAEEHGGYTLATFELTERRGGGECGAGVGTEARAAFLIEDGLIVEWIRAAGDSAPERPAEGPVI
jgi:hypothetical protein